MPSINKNNQSPKKENLGKVSLKDRFRALKNIPTFLKMIWKVSPVMAASTLSLRIVKSVLPVVILYVGKLILDEVIRLTTSAEKEYALLITYLLIELGLTVVMHFAGRAVTLLDSLLSDLYANATSVVIMKHAARMDMDQFEDSQFYDKLERARRQTLGRSVLMSQLFSQVEDIISVLFFSVGLATFNPWLILLLIVAVLPSFLSEVHFNERSYSLIHSWTPERRELDYLRYIGASDETAKEVKIFGLSDFLINRFSTLANLYYSNNKKLAVKRAAWGGLLGIVATLGYYTAYGYIIFQAVTGILTIGTLTFLAGSFMKMRSLLEGILSRFSSVAEGALYLQDLFDFLKLQPKLTAPSRSRPVPVPIRKGFEFENVGFKYINSDKWALRNLNFTLKAGEKLALVGENGAGKTTLVKLLSRLYEPTEGRILLDGVDLKEYNPEDIRKNIGVIFQDYVRFQMSASNNIAVGRIEEEDDYEKIENSARLSLADEVIESLPNRYQQVLGKRFPTGIELSGGQWQKIALARAYMRDAQVLILDEPTAALDARAEHEVFQRFAELTKGKTAVLISHRFSTVRMADRILVIENGSMVELGEHTELMEMNGRYAELFNLQARGYK